MKKNIRIQQYIESRIQQSQKQRECTTDPMAKLKLAITEVSFAHILNQYLQNNLYIFPALLHLAQVYILNQSYNEAIIQARLAKKQAQFLQDGSKQKATLLIAQCMVKQKKFQDAYEILKQFKLADYAKDCEQNLYQLMIEVLTQLGQQQKAYEAISRLQQIVKAKKGQKSVQFGFLLVKKGKTLGSFEKYKEAIDFINSGLDILIERKCKQKKQITEVYLLSADYYKKLNNLQKQYTSLICAHSMARQLEQPQRQVLPIIHMLAANLIEREDYTKALKQLKTAKNMQKQIYGESSTQIGKTVKKITEVLSKLNMRSEVKKYQQQYSRIIGPGTSTLKQKHINHQKTILT